MAEKTSLLVLRLEGALQSWGDGAKWDDRDSSAMPGKSAIVGLIACAMGLERNDPEIEKLSKAITVSVRADRPGTKTVDFHTVTGNPLLNAEGKKRNSNTIVTHRSYLQDASFLAVIAAQPEWHAKIAAALESPKWCMYLGRKSCVPSRPVLETSHPTETDPLELLKNYPAAERAEYPMLFETELPVEGAPFYMRPDERGNGSRSFEKRTVWRGIIKEAGNNVSD